MAEPNGNGDRIHISVNKLRAELAELELRIVREMAKELQPVRRDVDSLLRWRARLAGGMAVLGLLVSLISGYVFR